MTDVLSRTRIDAGPFRLLVQRVVLRVGRLRARDRLLGREVPEPALTGLEVGGDLGVAPEPGDTRSRVRLPLTEAAA